MFKRSFLLSLLLLIGTTVADEKASLPEKITNSIGMELVLIPSGEFMMGDAEEFTNAYPQHKVKISKPFYLGKTEVTQEEWRKVMGSKPPWDINDVIEGPKFPASIVSWEDAVEFCRRLSAKEGRHYRLPSEAEWEYACRAGTKTVYSFGDDAASLSEHAWYGLLINNKNKSESHAHKVGAKEANPWGLYDMHGNLWEWCSDYYSPYYYDNSPTADPKGPEKGKYYVQRGGSWVDNAEECKSYSRTGRLPEGSDDAGFRVVLEVGLSE